MRLLNIPKMYKEELLYSYLLRLAEANGFTNPKTFFNHRGIFPDKDDTKLRLDSLEDISFLLPRLSSYYTGAEIIADHTVLPAYLLFMSKVKQYLTVNAMVRKKRDYPNIVGHIMAGYIDDIYVCPDCLKEGHYLRRGHHLYGVKICHKHRMPLMKIIKDRKGMAERFEPVTGFDLEEQVKYAKFADELLKANISTDLYTVRQALGAKAKEEPDLEDRYLCIMTKLGFENPEALASRMYKESTMMRNIILGERFNILMCCAYALFGDVESFRKAVEKQGKYIVPEGYTVVDKRGVILELKHKACGTTFAATAYGIESGWSCPCCMEKDEGKIFDKMIQISSNGRFTTNAKLTGWKEEMEFFDYRRRESFVNTPYQVLKMVPDDIKNGTCETTPFDEVAAKVRSYGPFTLSSYTNGIEDVVITHDTCGHEFSERIHAFYKKPRCPVCKIRQDKWLLRFVEERTSRQYSLLGFHNDEAELLDMNTREVFNIDKKNLLKSLGSGVSTNALPVTKYNEVSLDGYDSMHAKVAVYLFTHYQENEDIDITKQQIENIDIEQLKIIFMILKKRGYLVSRRIGIYRLNISSEKLKQKTAKSVIREYISETYKVGDTFTLKELLGKEDIKYRAFAKALGVMRDNGEIDIVKPGVYKIKAFTVEYF